VSAETTPLSSLRVVLVAPRNPLNIGAAARAMSNFGCLNLRLVNPYEVAFREAKSAVKAQKVLENAREYATVGEAVADCGLVVGTTSIGHRALEHPLRRLEPGARLMKRKLASDLVALLFGSEKFGLSNDDMSHCNWLLRIPTRDEHASMNLGQAVAVCLYELAGSAPSELPDEKFDPASAGAIELITELLFESLQASGYVKPGTKAMFEKRTRRVMLRLNLQKLDAKILLGMVRQIAWKLRQDKS
jgi:tRNA/rRNA methyltransferase